MVKHHRFPSHWCLHHCCQDASAGHVLTGSGTVSSRGAQSCCRGQVVVHCQTLSCFGTGQVHRGDSGDHGVGPIHRVAGPGTSRSLASHGHSADPNMLAGPGTSWHLTSHGHSADPNVSAGHEQSGPGTAGVEAVQSRVVGQTASWP